MKTRNTGWQLYYTNAEGHAVPVIGTVCPTLATAQSLFSDRRANGEGFAGEFIGRIKGGSK